MNKNWNWVQYTYEIVPTYWIDSCVAFDYGLKEKFTCVVTYRRRTRYGHRGLVRYKLYLEMSVQAADILINLKPVIKENILQIWIESMLTKHLKVDTYTHKIIGKSETEHWVNLSTVFPITSLEKIIEVALENDNKTKQE